jgi:hypothetical protein
VSVHATDLAPSGTALSFSAASGTAAWIRRKEKSRQYSKAENA